MGEGAARPRFSVITAAYNAEDTIADALDSVIAQTLPDWEVLVVDDGSTDRTGEIIAEYASRDVRITATRQANAGAAVARNAAAAAARAPHLVVLDADDMMRPDYLESQAAFIDRHPGYAIYSCNGHYYDRRPTLKIWRGRRFARVQSYTLEQMLYKCWIFVMAVVSKAEFDATGGFRAESWVEDYDLWLRLLARGGRHIHNPATLGLYRLTAGSKSTAPSRVIAATLESLDHLGAEHPDLAARADYASALGVWQHRLAIARLDEAVASGQAGGARRTFVRHVFGARPTLARRVLGTGAMLLSPSLYRAVFLGRVQASGG
jgi:glycosyltransferase involved in cell wall biosynthesis